MKEEAPVSAKTRKGMSLNIDDRKWIKRQNDDLIDYIKEKLDDNLRFIAEILIDNNNKMLDFMDEIRGELKKINKRLDEHEARITRLEDCIKLKNAG